MHDFGRGSVCVGAREGEGGIRECVWGRGMGRKGGSEVEGESERARGNDVEGKEWEEGVVERERERG